MLHFDNLQIRCHHCPYFLFLFFKATMTLASVYSLILDLGSEYDGF